MTIRTYVTYPPTASEAILPGYACGIDTGKVDLIDDATQATTVTVTPLGISATEATADGDTIAVVGFGEAMGVAGTGGLAAGQSFVAEASTGKLLPYAESAYVDGQTVWILGRALEAIAANAKGRVFVQLQQISVSEP
jgi:hypothetical protein